MSMINIDLMSPLPPDGPYCEVCHGRTRLVGVEPHPRLTRTDLRTYECAACESVQVVAAPHPKKSVNAVVPFDATFDGQSTLA
jgi:hypothetical protein